MLPSDLTHAKEHVLLLPPRIQDNQTLDNQKIAKTLAQLADLLEFTGANPFRLRAYRNGARIIQDMTDPLANLVSDVPI